MPADTGFQRYDLTRLAPRLEAGCTVLTPNYRLARRIKSEWDSRQQAAGLNCWQPVAVLPLESYLLNQWRRAHLAGEVPALRLLNGLLPRFT